jgi:hypothetical protein
MMEPDPLKVSLEDTDLLAEVQLLTNLIVAASQVENSLEQEHIDEVLGVSALRGSEAHTLESFTGPRTRESDQHCPRCGATLLVEEHPVEVAEPPVLDWRRVRSWCPGGCQLTVEDFTFGQ